MNASNFKKAGFNLFASVKVSELPDELTKALSAENTSIDSESTLCLLASGGKELWSHLPLPLNAALNLFHHARAVWISLASALLPPLQ